MSSRCASASTSRCAPSLAANFERWNGRGLPTGAKGDAIPRPMRIAQLSQEFEVLARIEGIERALEIIRGRRGKAYDPELADVVLAGAAGWWDEVEDRRPLGRGARPSRPVPAADRRGRARVAARARRLRRPQVAVDGRALAGVAELAA